MGQTCLASNKHQNTNGICIKACTAKEDGIPSPRENTLYSNSRTYNTGVVVRNLVMIQRFRNRQNITSETI